ncbi:nucleotidyltransferase family protein [Streptomyces graminilatus]|uniref:nucleotidyltransferase family protein n=1 Tax=Streptomyces graminilatus TaxID=1464070 RepID=UPI0006E3DD0F|nr:nucleotidyltransferase family protein [Streptomyces graminilatus]
MPGATVTGLDTALVRQAVILAGGQASRLRPYTDRVPKALVEVAGRPIFEHQAHWLAAEGIEEVVVSCGYLADVLKEYVASHRLPLRVRVVVEDEPLGRGGGLKHAARRLPFPEERWVGLNGDILTRFSLRDLARTHVERSATTTVAVTPLKSPYGVVELSSDNHVTEFVEAPVLPHWINAGVYLFEPEVTALLPDLGDHEDTTFPSLAEQGRLTAYRINGYWRGVDNAKDLKTASAEVTAFGWPTAAAA